MIVSALSTSAHRALEQLGHRMWPPPSWCRKCCFQFHCAVHSWRLLFTCGRLTRFRSNVQHVEAVGKGRQEQDRGEWTKRRRNNMRSNAQAGLPQRTQQPARLDVSEPVAAGQSTVCEHDKGRPGPAGARVPPPRGNLWPGLSLPDGLLGVRKQRLHEDESRKRLTTQILPVSHTSRGEEPLVWRKFPPRSGAVRPTNGGVRISLDSRQGGRNTARGPSEVAWGHTRANTGGKDVWQDGRKRRASTSAGSRKRVGSAVQHLLQRAWVLRTVAEPVDTSGLVAAPISGQVGATTTTGDPRGRGLDHPQFVLSDRGHG